jgi:hypothetical protein
MMPIRRFDSMLDALLSVEVTVRPGSSSAVAILQEQSGLCAYRLSENVVTAAAQMVCIGSPASKQVTYGLMTFDGTAATPVWFESVNPTRAAMRGRCRPMLKPKPDLQRLPAFSRFGKTDLERCG